MSSRCVSHRDKIVRELKDAGLSIHSFGACEHNAEMSELYPECNTGKQEDLVCLASKYHFCVQIGKELRRIVV